MAVCAATTRTGAPCKALALPGATLCYLHDPARAAQRARNASKAGKAGGNGRPGAPGELGEIRELLKGLFDDVLAGDAKPGPAAIAGQLLNTRLRLLEVERRLKEAAELEERLAVLEAAAQERQGRQR